MNLFECFRVAIRGLLSNKLRTGLTMLGLIIGVGVVIIVVGIGEGAKQRVTEAVNSMGTNLLNITSDRNRLRIGTATSRSLTNSTTSTPNTTPVNSLLLQDAKQIASNFRASVDKIAPQIDSDIQVRLGDIDTTTEVAGTSIDYPYVKRTDVAKGRFFNQDEVDAMLKVCVVGPSVVEHLTGDADADITGQTLLINRQ